MLAGARRHKMGDPDIDTNHRASLWRVDGHFLIIGEGEPPHALTLVELHTAVELLHLLGFWVSELCFMIGSQFDGHRDGLTFRERTDAQPVIIGGVLGHFQFHHVDIGLNTGFTQDRNVPFAPLRFFRPGIQRPVCLFFLVAL